MTGNHQCQKSPRESQRGFALVACMLMMALLMVLGIGVMSLSAIELRRTTRDENAASARANARMALMEAIGQL